MPYSSFRPRELTMKVFRGSYAVTKGLLTPNQLRSSAWERLFQDVYADCRLSVDHKLLCVGAGLLIPDDVAITGLSACLLFGVDLISKDARVEVIQPRLHRLPPTRGIRLYTQPFDSTSFFRRSLPRRTNPLFTAIHVARHYSTEDAVMVLDALAHANLVKRSALMDQIPSVSPRPWGYARAARAVELMDELAESPQESRLRVKLRQAGIPKPISQYTVRIDDRFIARVDLAWPARRVVMEYDGHWHANREQLYRDRRRLNELVLAGWTVLHVTADRMGRDFDGVLKEIRTALRI